MSGRRKALIVASGEYDHGGLRRLLSPAADVEALTTILDDPRSGTLTYVSCTTRLRRPHTGVVSVAFSPDGKTLATGSADKTVRLWDVSSRYQIGHPLTGHTHGVRSVAFSPDEKTLGTGSYDHTARLWDVTSHQ